MLEPEEEHCKSWVVMKSQKSAALTQPCPNLDAAALPSVFLLTWQIQSLVPVPRAWLTTPVIKYQIIDLSIVIQDQDLINTTNELIMCDEIF